MNRPDRDERTHPAASASLKMVLCGLNARYIHTNLALRSLISYARTSWTSSEPDGFPVPTLILREWSINDQVLAMLARLAREEADCYAFSCYIWNIDIVRRLSRSLKKVRPQARIIWGGPEVSHQAERLLQPDQHEPVDLIVCGEGERAFVALLRAMQAAKMQSSITIPAPDIEQPDGQQERNQKERNRQERNQQAKSQMEVRLLETVPNLCWRDQTSQAVRRNGTAPLLDGSAWPFPYTAGELAANADRMLYYETSRGCPFSCTYCLSAIDRTARFRPLDQVYLELDQFLAANVMQVKFVDRTFNCNTDRARKIWQYLIDQSRLAVAGNPRSETAESPPSPRCRTNFHFEVAGDLLDDASVDLLLTAPPGLIQLEIGVQTIQPEILRTINRVSRPDIIARQVSRLRNGGNIHLHLDLIAGLPGETLAGVAATFNWIAALRPHQLQLGFLKVLSGAPIAAQAKERDYQWLDEPPYEVLSSDQLSFDDICRLKRIEAVSNLFMNSGFFPEALPWLMSRWPDPFALFDELADWMDQQMLLDRALSRDERSRLLHRFAEERCPGLAEDTWLAGAWLDLLRLDYLGGGQKDLPAWMNFWENTTDPASRADLQQARRLYRQRHPASTRFRLDCLSFDWERLSRDGELVPAAWLVGFEWSGAVTRMTECLPRS